MRSAISCVCACVCVYMCACVCARARVCDYAHRVIMIAVYNKHRKLDVEVRVLIVHVCPMAVKHHAQSHTRVHVTHARTHVTRTDPRETFLPNMPAACEQCRPLSDTHPRVCV